MKKYKSIVFLFAYLTFGCIFSENNSSRNKTTKSPLGSYEYWYYNSGDKYWIHGNLQIKSNELIFEEKTLDSSKGTIIKEKNRSIPIVQITNEYLEVRESREYEGDTINDYIFYKITSDSIYLNTAFVYSGNNKDIYGTWEHVWYELTDSNMYEKGEETLSILSDSSAVSTYKIFSINRSSPVKIKIYNDTIHFLDEEDDAIRQYVIEDNKLFLMPITGWGGANKL